MTMAFTPHAAQSISIDITAPLRSRYEEVLSASALAFIADLARNFESRRKALLERRAIRQARFNAGSPPDFLADTRHIREGHWQIRGIPSELQDRRVEITGPVDRKMIINAVNSGAKVFMADFEDATSPTWDNLVQGQVNLKEYWRGQINFTDDVSGKSYAVGPNPAMLMVRPRGWHLLEEHVLIGGEPIAGAFFDFGLYMFHNARLLAERGSRPYFYLPKMESHLEARLWNDVISHAQSALGLPVGTTKVTVLIETLPAAFEMDEILFELRDHIIGLNCGRWDYIFSFIKTLAQHPGALMPDRGQVVMGKDFLRAYSLLLIKTCHRRGAFAMGGMSAFIPNRKDADVNARALAAVQADKEREASEGHDGTWVAHPDLVPVALEVFNRLMPDANQISRQRDDVVVAQGDLLKVHAGGRSEEGLRGNIRVGVQYIEAWLRGSGAVPLYNLMEDAATAEISRTQVWQQIRHAATLNDGRSVTVALLDELLADEMAKLRDGLGADIYDAGRFPEAITLFRDMSVSAELQPFLTLPAYRHIV